MNERRLKTFVKSNAHQIYYFVLFSFLCVEISLCHSPSAIPKEIRFAINKRNCEKYNRLFIFVMNAKKLNPVQNYFLGSLYGNIIFLEIQYLLQISIAT